MRKYVLNFKIKKQASSRHQYHNPSFLIRYSHPSSFLVSFLFFTYPQHLHHTDFFFALFFSIFSFVCGFVPIPSLSYLFISFPPAFRWPASFISSPHLTLLPFHCLFRERFQRKAAWDASLFPLEQQCKELPLLISVFVLLGDSPMSSAVWGG